jgi:hypothetical protein
MQYAQSESSLTEYAVMILLLQDLTVHKTNETYHMHTPGYIYMWYFYSSLNI